MNLLKDKIALVTGGSRGLGRRTALLFAEEGATVIFTDLQENDSSRELLAELQKMQPRSMFIASNAADYEDTLRVADIVQKEFGRLDVLVNNAGYGYFGALETVPLEEGRKQMDVNLFGMVSLTRRVIPVMRSQGTGRIVNVSSVAGRMCFCFGGWYNISKYAVEAFSDVLRMETKPFGTQVVIIEPGWAQTEWGLIAAAHLRESSAGTIYEDMAEGEASLLAYAFGHLRFPSPMGVAKAVVKASLSRRPRLRYHPGGGGVALLVLRKLLPARVWDSLLLSALRLMARKKK